MTNKERLQIKSRARRLLNNGVPLRIDPDDEGADLLMRQIGGETESCAFDLGYKSGYSSVPTLCEQNQLVIGNRLNFVGHRLCK